MSSSDDRQRVVRVAGSRRAQLTPAPGTGGEPASDDETTSAASAAPGAGPNDERMRREVPPHY